MPAATPEPVPHPPPPPHTHTEAPCRVGQARMDADAPSLPQAASPLSPAPRPCGPAILAEQRLLFRLLLGPWGLHLPPPRPHLLRAGGDLGEWSSLWVCRMLLGDRTRVTSVRQIGRRVQGVLAGGLPSQFLAAFRVNSYNSHDDPVMQMVLLIF